MPGRVHYIDGTWCEGTGPVVSWREPTHQTVTWTGAEAGPTDVDRAVAAARGAFAAWAARGVDERIALLHAYRGAVESRREALAVLIARDTGKPLWEAGTEVEAMLAKVDSSVRARAERRAPSRREKDGRALATHFRPHGVVAVLGPFNLPGHLPNAHIVPALLAGNTVVFKPSEQAPAVAEALARLWQESGLPKGVFNMVQGGRETGRLVVQHGDCDGLYFTGGYATGKAIHAACAGRPEKILALELGGNNPLGIWRASDHTAAAYWTIQSAFLTAGQRCTCARRLIVADGDEGERLLAELVRLTARIRIGAWDSRPEPFMGPVISEAAAESMLEAQERLRAAGGRVLLEMKRTGEGRAMLTPAILDVTAVSDRPDVEYFGPLLQVIRVRDFDALIEEANRTAFGLAAALLSDDRELFEAFLSRVRAGIVQWNRATTGASGNLPFGGAGRSGNHRPSGYYAADYCAYPVASMEDAVLKMPPEVTQGFASALEGLSRGTR